MCCRCFCIYALFFVFVVVYLRLTSDALGHSRVPTTLYFCVVHLCLCVISQRDSQIRFQTKTHQTRYLSVSTRRLHSLTRSCLRLGEWQQQHRQQTFWWLCSTCNTKFHRIWARTVMLLLQPASMFCHLSFDHSTLNYRRKWCEDANYLLNNTRLKTIRNDFLSVLFDCLLMFENE